MKLILPYLWYPLLFTGAISGFYYLLTIGTSAAVAAYSSIVLVGIILVILERILPERMDWHPTIADIKADAAFMVLIQIVLPRGLVAFAVLIIATSASVNQQSKWWPHDWPLAVQVIAMVLIVDFLRYWLHRACHHFTLLWRLHEVHHSPDILYLLNVSRFHPLEKVLHFSLDSVPFLLLGVSPQVIAGYFLLYSVNGFFQHSNLKVRYGWLNYVMGSAETHRWHHARDPKTASCNFGNTVIIWDLLFGTWHLPNDRALADIGIPDRNYPKGFGAQMLMPFRERRGQRSLKAWFADTIMNLSLRLISIVRGREIAAMTRNPMQTQTELLKQILHANKTTTFGVEHHFTKINDYQSFIHYVPVYEYEGLRRYVNAEIERGDKALTNEPPYCYARTSGTTGQPKDIPITLSHLKALRRIHETAVARQHRLCADAFSGGILAIVSPVSEGTLSNGKIFGSASGLVARNTPAAVREKFVVPAPVLTIKDSHVKYLLILRLAIARRNITYIGIANPTTLLLLIKLYREYQSALINDVETGNFFLADKVPAQILSAISNRLHADPIRANALRKLQIKEGGVRIADLWPKLRLIVSWTCASTGLAADALRQELTPSMHILELGYISSEFRGTVTIGRGSGCGLPTLDTHFFEFVERDKWDRGEPEFLTLDKIRKGIDYYIIVTTPSGLYRYFMNDLVKVKGFLHKTPLLKFQQKGKGVTNITGEKLYETQILAAVRTALSRLNCTSRFTIMLADEEAQRYCLYIETESNINADASQLAAMTDAALAEINIEYQAKRESGRLHGIDAHWLIAGTGEAYKQYCVSQGQREGQFKMVGLTYRKSFSFNLDNFIES